MLRLGTTTSNSQRDRTSTYTRATRARRPSTHVVHILRCSPWVLVPRRELMVLEFRSGGKINTSNCEKKQKRTYPTRNEFLRLIVLFIAVKNMYMGLRDHDSRSVLRNVNIMCIPGYWSYVAAAANISTSSSREAIWLLAGQRVRAPKTNNTSASPAMPDRMCFPTYYFLRSDVDFIVKRGEPPHHDLK